MSSSAAARPAILMIGALLLSACASRAPDQTAVAPSMTIERFLRAANQNDLDTMANLFGTAAGPIADRNSDDVDRQMFLLASLLRHTDYTIATQQIVPGRRDEATQFVVRMTLSNKTADVPFVLVRSRSSHWLIENICVERITRENATC